MKEAEKSEKITDAVLLRSIVSSAIGIVLCMICLIGTTWAWYSSSVASGENVTVGANFDFTVVITDNVEPDANGVYTFENGIYLFKGGESTVALTKTGTSASGFCQIIATKSGEDAGTTYYVADFRDDEPVSFKVIGAGSLKLTPMWGALPSDCDGVPEGGIELTVEPDPPKDGSPDATVPMENVTADGTPEEIIQETQE